MNVQTMHKYLDHFWSIVIAVNIRVKIIGIMLGLVFLLGLTVTWQVRQLLSQEMYAQLSEQAVALTRDLAARSADPVLLNDAGSLRQLLQDTQSNQPNVRYAFVLDTQGNVLAHTFDGRFPVELISANEIIAGTDEQTTILDTAAGQIWDTAVPVFEGQAGVVRLGLSDAQVLQTIDTITGQLLLTTVMVSVIGISAAVFLTWILTRPLLDLVDATEAVQRGDFSYRVEHWADDEIGKLKNAFNDMIEALEKADAERAEREQIRANYVQGVITAQEDERKRIARELHDSTSQSLTSLIIGLKTLEDTCDQCRKQTHVIDLRSIAGQTLDDVHTMSVQLRPSVLDDLGLPEAIRRHIADNRQRYPLDIDLAIIGLDDKRLPDEVETALYRIVQEGLTNIIRHAEADTVSILIEYRDDKVLVVVEDDGKGFDVMSTYHLDGHLGLYGIRERAELLSGTVEIESEIGQGTSLFIEIPLPDETQTKM